MMTCVDSNLVAFYWTWSLNRWLSARFNMLSSAVLGCTTAAAVLGFDLRHHASIYSYST